MIIRFARGLNPDKSSTTEKETFSVFLRGCYSVFKMLDIRGGGVGVEARDSSASRRQ